MTPKQAADVPEQRISDEILRFDGKVHATCSQVLIV